MSVSINIPEELYNQALAIAETRQIPVEEVFATAYGPNNQSADWV